MTELRHRDIAGALALVAELGAVSEPDDVPALALPALRRLIGADVASFSGGRRDGGAVFRFDPEGALQPICDDEVDRGIAERHPLVRRMLRTGDGTALRVTDVMSQRRFEQLAIHRERFRPAGVRFQLLAGMEFAPPLPSGIGFARASSDFGERERTLLELLRRPLATVYRNVLARRTIAPSRAAAFGLTQRETEVLGLVAAGLADGEIAGRLFLSVRTVEKHLEHAYKKLGVSTRSSAVAKLRTDTY